MKTCNYCGIEKPMADFKKRADRPRINNRCASCRKVQDKKYWYTSPKGRKEYTLMRKYNLLWEKYQEMIIKQSNLCAICGQSNSSGPLPGQLVVDHCHVSGKVRELLCDLCNRGLGSFKDDAELLNRAISYLKKHQQSETK